MFDTDATANVQEQAALREELDTMRAMLDEALKRIVPAKKVVVIQTDIATMSCKQLRARIIRERGAQAAATLATKLNRDLTQLGKNRVVLQRAVRNGNGMHVHD